MKTLSTESKQFFSLLAELTFLNPFDFEPCQLESLLDINSRGIIKGVDGTGTLHKQHLYGAVLPELTKRLKQLKEQGIARLSDIVEADRELFEYAILFLIYHQSTENFDKHIQQQVASPDKIIKAPFVKHIINELTAYGFELPKAYNYLALFFQFRRAYYFIDHELVGNALCMKHLRRSLWNNIFTADVRLYNDHLWDKMEDFSTLLLGETGTGKGSAATAIGRAGLIPFDTKQGQFNENFMQAFIPINLLEYSDTLIESELFGHRKGAFTGAIDNHKGLFERCSRRGSLLLDEIGDIPITLQTKLLNVLQQRSFSPVGGHDRKRFNGRVIAATSRDLETLRQRGQFRDDLYYRLSSDVIVMPSLHKRIGESSNELELLVSSLIQRMTHESKPSLVDKVVSILNRQLPKGYHWPGNVRELEQAVRHIILNNQYTPAQVLSSSNEPQSLLDKKISAQALTAHYCQRLYRELGTFEQVAKITHLDRRTVKKYIQLNSD